MNWPKEIDPIHVLMAEDNDDDYELTRIGFQQSRLAINLHRVSHGEECMEFLQKVGHYGEAPTPDLLLLDINMPRMDGFEVLAAIDKDPGLRAIPVVVLTTSRSDEDILTAYGLNCSSFITKPVDFHQFAVAIQGMTNYWFTVVTLPPKIQ